MSLLGLAKREAGRWGSTARGSAQPLACSSGASWSPASLPTAPYWFFTDPVRPGVFPKRKSLPSSIFQPQTRGDPAVSHPFLPGPDRETGPKRKGDLPRHTQQVPEVLTQQSHAGLFQGILRKSPRKPSSSHTGDVPLGGPGTVAREDSVDRQKLTKNCLCPLGSQRESL